MQAEAKFFCIQELDAACEKSLKSLKDKKDVDVVPICRVPLITSHKEEQVLDLVFLPFLFLKVTQLFFQFYSRHSFRRIRRGPSSSC